MATFKDKLSLLIEKQAPEFVLSDHPKFLEFVKTYFTFMESAELAVTNIETTDVNCGPDIRFNFPQNTGIFTVPGFISTPEDLYTVLLVPEDFVLNHNNDNVTSSNTITRLLYHLQ